MIRKLWNVIRYSFGSDEREIVESKVSKSYAIDESVARNRAEESSSDVVFFPEEANEG
jgi:hypothetical protein